MIYLALEIRRQFMKKSYYCEKLEKTLQFWPNGVKFCCSYAEGLKYEIKNLKSRKCELHCGLEKFLIHSQDICKPTTVDVKDIVTPSHISTGNKRNKLNCIKIKKLVYQRTLSAKSEESTQRMGETICKSSF